MRELKKYEDDFIIAKLEGKEYVIDSIGHNKIYGDRDNMHCICLNVRDGGQGNIKR